MIEASFYESFAKTGNVRHHAKATLPSGEVVDVDVSSGSVCGAFCRKLLSDHGVNPDEPIRFLRKGRVSIPAKPVGEWAELTVLEGNRDIPRHRPYTPFDDKGVSV